MSGVFEVPPRCNYDAFVISSLRSSLLYKVLNARSESKTSSLLRSSLGFVLAVPHLFVLWGKNVCGWG